MRRTLGLAIQKACAIALRAVLGIRIPAARIRIHDQAAIGTRSETLTSIGNNTIDRAQV